MTAPDPFDPALPDPFDHAAFYTDTIGEACLVMRPNGPLVGDMGDFDSGLRCWCGREIVSCEDAESGWVHVGIGDKTEPTGQQEWNHELMEAL